VLSENLKPKIFKVTKAIGTNDNEPNGAVDAFDKALRDPIEEIIEEFGPPVSEGLDKLEQEAIAGVLDLPEPGS
jgi:hypothetical protein